VFRATLDKVLNNLVNLNGFGALALECPNKLHSNKESPLKIKERVKKFKSQVLYVNLNQSF
jgi:hypothetical protein